MTKPILIIYCLALAACSSQPLSEALSPVAANRPGFSAEAAPAKPAAAAAAPKAAAFATPPIPAADSEQVCETRKRPGSNISQTVCYTRNAETERALRGQIDELEREARWRDEIIRQSVLEGRRPSGFGIGPN